MGAALQLFADLGITYFPPDQQTSRRPMATNCLGVVERMIRKFGRPHATITLRTIVESKGNECALIADIVDAVSDLILANPRWPARGLEFIEAFDQIDLLLEIRKAAKATGVQPLRAGIMALVGIQLTQILGPSRPPKSRPPVRVRREPKPPRSVTRIPETERGIALGVELLQLRATISRNTTFGQAVRSRFDVDQKRASQVMRVARLYAMRPEIHRAVSWRTLVELASPHLSAEARSDIEAKIAAGDRFTHTQIRARRPLRSGPSKKEPAARMAA
jgi:hypothetical protein